VGAARQATLRGLYSDALAPLLLPDEQEKKS